MYANVCHLLLCTWEMPLKRTKQLSNTCSTWLLYKSTNKKIKRVTLTLLFYFTFWVTQYNQLFYSLLFSQNKATTACCQATRRLATCLECHTHVYKWNKTNSKMFQLCCNKYQPSQNRLSNKIRRPEWTFFKNVWFWLKALSPCTRCLFFFMHVQKHWWNEIDY